MSKAVTTRRRIVVVAVIAFVLAWEWWIRSRSPYGSLGVTQPSLGRPRGADLLEDGFGLVEPVRVG